MELTRRRLLQAGGAAAAVAIVYSSPLTSAAIAAAESSAIPPYLIRSTYLDLTDKVFRIGDQQLVLKEVADFAVAGIQPNLAENEDAFSLIFSGPASGELGSGIKRLTNSEMGTLDIYVGPVNDSAANEYEVIVNRVLNRSERRLRPPKPPAERPATGQAAPPGQSTPTAARRTIAKSPVRGIDARRTDSGIKVVAQLKPKSQVKHVTGWVARNGRPVGTGTHTVKSNSRLALNVKLGKRPRRGSYDITLMTVDRRGVEAFQIATVVVD